MHQMHSSQGTITGIMITTTKSPWRWQVWCAETWRIDSVEEYIYCM